MSKPTFSPIVCVHELFVAQAIRSPDAVAISSPFENAELTYSQVHAIANTAAYALRALLPSHTGVENTVEYIIGLSIDEGCALPLTELAVLVAGAAFVPVSGTDPIGTQTINDDVS